MISDSFLNQNNAYKLKLNWYSEFKTEFTHEPYLNVVKIRKYRRALASFRISSHILQVEKGRRKCAVSQSEIEDE